MNENSESLMSHRAMYATLIINHMYHCSTNAFTDTYIVMMDITVVKESSHSCIGVS